VRWYHLAFSLLLCVFFFRLTVYRPTSDVRLTPSTTIFSEEDLAKRGPEVGVEDGVDDRIEETVYVAEPDDDADERCRIVAAIAAERPQNGHDEERQPAENERPGDDGQRPCRLALASLFDHLSGGASSGTAGHRRRPQAKRDEGRQPRSGEFHPAGSMMRRRRRGEQQVGGLPR